MIRKNPFTDFSFPAAAQPDLPGLDLNGAELPDKKTLAKEIQNFLVFPEKWTATHPSLSMPLKCGSDKYYADLASRLKTAMLMLPLPLDNVPKDLLDEAAMVCAAYFEDLVSGIGVWDAIRTLHRAKYGVWLPFYDCTHDDYLLDNINLEDLKFLIWQAWCRTGMPDDMIYSPLAESVELMAELAYDLLNEEYETAPESTRVADTVARIFRHDDFLAVRSLAEWLVFRNPLTRNRYAYDNAMSQAENMGENNYLNDVDKAFYYVTSQGACRWATGPEGLRAGEYLSEMARAKGFAQAAANLEQMELVGPTLFRVGAVDKKAVRFEDAAGRIYEVVKSSFAKGTYFNEVQGYMATIARYGDKWLLNGLAVGVPADPFAGKESRLTDFGDNPVGREMAARISEAHKGQRIFYCRNMEEVSQTLGIEYRPGSKDSDAPQDILLLLSDEGIRILGGYAAVIKDRKNPLYDKQGAEEVALKFLTAGLTPDDIAAIMQAKAMLPDAKLSCSQGKRMGRRLVKDNLRFLLGFYRTC